jgi:hypothetical protein
VVMRNPNKFNQIALMKTIRMTMKVQQLNELLKFKYILYE